MKPLLVVAGEPSADRYAGRLIQALRQLDSDQELEVFGLGGPFMREAGARLMADFSGLSHIGPLEAAASLTRYWTIFRALLREADKQRPQVAVLLDFPDFNLPLAKRLKQMGIRVLYYISPQVWAWRRGRVKSIARWVDRMFVIFPFEVDFYRRHGVDVEFVGHPLLEQNNADFDPGAIRRMLRVGDDRRLVTLFPGSRQKEVAYMLPTLLEAVCLISQKRACHYAIVKANGIEESFVRRLWRQAAEAHPELADGTIPMDLLDCNPEEALAESDAAIVKSGTATLQAALAGVPFVMVYKISPASWLVGKVLVRTRFYCIVNLIAGKAVVPELLQSEASPERIAAETLALLEDPTRKKKMQEEFQRVRDSLGSSRASETLASIVSTEMGLNTAAQFILPAGSISQYIH